MPDQPDQTVNVSVEGSDFSFDPDPVRMTASGNIILMKFPHTATWKLVDAHVKDGGTQFHVTPTPGGQKVSIRDDHTSLGTWDYNVTIEVDGSRTTSPDPQIVNTDPE